MALTSIARSVSVALFFLAMAASGACKKNEAARCDRCGMLIVPESAFRTELLMPDTGGKTSFDTVKCALKKRATRKVRTTVRVQEYYSRTWTDGENVVFVVGSDVLGPMGKDLVPVAPAQADKFVHDHGGDKTLKLGDISEAVLNGVP
ncbi:MAG: nitrous oxide reductase accessory protein NosL [Polyangiaceae bacterium]